MPRHFVNGLANFSIEGGMVSFTLQDQALRNEGGQMRPGQPEPVGHFIMREEDFGKLLTVLNQHFSAYLESQARGPKGGPGSAPGHGAPPARPVPAAPAAKPAAQAQAGKPQGFRIRPKG